MATKTVSVLTGGSNSHTTSSEEINAAYTDLLVDGVVGAIASTSGVAPTTGSFAVNAQGTPDMTVRVTAGQAYVTGTPSGGNSQRFRVNMATYEDVTIAANSTGGTRYDHIYISLDAAKLATPGVGGDDVATLVASRSTSSSSDTGTPPTYGYKIAVVTVANGASSITNGNITDSRVQTGSSSIAATAVIPNNIITAATLSTSAIKLGYAAITADVSTASTTVVAATGLSVTVTIPSGSRSIKITAYIAGTYNSGANQCRLSIWDGTVGSGTQIAGAFNGNAAGQIVPVTMMAVVTPSAGSKTYNVGYYGSGAGTTYITGASASPSFILVEAI